MEKNILFAKRLSVPRLILMRADILLKVLLLGAGRKDK